VVDHLSNIERDDNATFQSHFDYLQVTRNQFAALQHIFQFNPVPA
jgi:hypothetical protein